MIQDFSKCTGCSACLNICPSDAISKKENKFGFLYPVIENSKCINCRMCDEVCPISKDVFQDNSIQKAFAAINNNLDIQETSSSAGVFSLIAIYILNQGGVVFGAAWENKYSIAHRKIENKKELFFLRKSKYIQSNINYIFSEVKEELKKNRLVLFSGTPCQVAGLKSFLGREYEKLYLVDVVCHGVPNSNIYRSFIEFEEKRWHRVIETLDFRYKIPNKASYITAIKYKKGGRDYLQYEPWFGTSYGYFFMKGYTLRDSCYMCKYTKPSRVGDVTLGDFWGVKEVFPNLDERNGVGLVVVNSHKGESLIKAISTDVKLYECSIDDAVKRNPQMSRPVDRPHNKEKVLEYISRRDYASANSYYRRSLDLKTHFKRYRYKASIMLHNIKNRNRM